MPRKLDDFIDAYLAYTQDQESPEVFHLWTSIGLIAAVLRQRTWIDRRQYKIYPNAYVILVSDSGICRKSTAVKIGEDLLFGMDIQGPLLLPQRATPEMMVNMLKGKIETDPVLKSPCCGGVIIASELDSMFAGDETRKRHMLTLLTDLYDVPKQFNTATLKRKQEILPRPCITLIGASTMEWLKDIVGSRGVGGGFASRVYFIRSEVTDRFTPHPTKDTELRAALIDDLIDMAEYRGPWTIDTDALPWFEEYYRKCHQFASYCEDAFRGYASRKSDHMLRLALILSVSEGVETQAIGLNQMERAADIVESFEDSLHTIYDDILTTGDGKLRGEVLKFIGRKKDDGIFKHEITRRFYRQANARQLDEVIATLEQADLIERVLVKGNSTKIRRKDD